MTDANTELKQIAIRIANGLEGHTLGIKKKLKLAELRVEELKLKLKESTMARQRSIDFSPTVGKDLPCPACFVRGDIKSTLIPRNSPTDTDIYACDTCTYEFRFTP